MEKNLAQFSNTYSQGLWIASLIFLVVALLRLFSVLKTKSSRHWIHPAKSGWFVIAIKLLFFVGLLAFLADIPVWFFTVAQFRPIAPKLPYWFFIFVMLYITIQEMILSLTASQALVDGFVKRMVFFLISIFCSFSFILAAFIVPTTYNYPTTSECVILNLPVKGTWLAMHAGKEKWVNYHSNYPPQRFAIDMVKLNEAGYFFNNNGEDSCDFNSFGDSVFAPSNGIVFALADGFPTQKIYAGDDSINPAGNYIEMKLAENKYLFLAHLKAGSLQINLGDTLREGQFIALSGNSGNSSFPHLHMHLQDKSIINDSLSTGLPFRFKLLERKRVFSWEKLENSWLIRNDQFRN